MDAGAQAAAGFGRPEVSDLQAVVAAGSASFATAIRSSRPVDHDIAVVGRRVRIRCADADLADALLGALSVGRIAPAGTPDLSILAWQGPPHPWIAPLADGETAALTADGVTLQARWGEAACLVAFAGRERLALNWLANVATVPAPERCKPFLPILHWWLADSDWQLAHAAAVGRGATGVLLAGRGGSGKSSAALACLRAGWQIAGDDCVLITDRPAPRVEPLYGSVRLQPDMAARFPELAPLRMALPGAAAADKHDYLIASTGAFSGFAVRAIVLPRIGAARTALHAASRAEALRALAPSTLALVKGGSGLAFDRIGRFVDALPCVRLDLGPDLESIPGAIASVLERGEP